GATDANERAMLGVAPGAVVLQAALICRAARASDHVYLLRIDARETLEPGVKDVIGERPHAPLNIRLDNNAGHPLKQAGLWSGWVRALTLGNLTCIADGVMIGGLDVHHGWGLSVGMGRCGAAQSWASSTIRPPVSPNGSWREQHQRYRAFDGSFRRDSAGKISTASHSGPSTSVLICCRCRQSTTEPPSDRAIWSMA